MQDFDVLVIGGGVVGLAIGRKLALSGHAIVVCERHAQFGTETSSRNSEVIHAGIYYPPRSLKARFCVDGRIALYKYCQERHVSYNRCGKLILATREADTAILKKLSDNATRLGTETQLISEREVKIREPALRCHGALESLSTGIIDSHALMTQYVADMEMAGGLLACSSPVQAFERRHDHWRVTVDGDPITARWVVNAAGLEATRIASLVPGVRLQQVPITRYARGLYAKAIPSPRFNRLVYPVPEPGGLGIHATIDLGGSVRFGPDIEWISEIDYRTDDKRLDFFRDAVARYWPNAEFSEFICDYTGIRPKLSLPDDHFADFQISGPDIMGVTDQIHLFGIESPGLTASLAIADYVASLIN